MKSSLTAAVLVIAAGALQGCMKEASVQAGAGSPVYATDLAGKAATCTVPTVTPVDGKTVTVAMTTGGGGWCGIPLMLNGKPYGAGLLSQAPKAGKVYVHAVGDATRVDYTPTGAAAGPDAFAVRLIPGNAVLRVAVNSPAQAGAAK